MKFKDTLVQPYVLAAGHPIMHVSLLTASLILHGVNNEQFFNIPNEASCTAATGTKAQDFISGGKYTLIG